VSFRPVADAVRRKGFPLLRLGAVLACLGATAQAEPLPRPEQIVLPEEKEALADLNAALLARKPTGPDVTLRQFDALLAKTQGPTKLRGLVQFFRAGLLESMGRDAASREAVDESIRLLPGYAGPLLFGARIYVYDDLPGEAADLLIRASNIDPALLAKLDEYEVANVMRRLEAQNDRRRIRLLSDRLLDIGWQGGSLQSRSRLARETMEARVKEGDLAGARRLVPKLISPGDSRALLIDRRYQPLWADVERWAGPRLEQQWSVFLRESRAKWQASKNPESAAAYAGALRSAGHYRTLVREILPLFKRPLDRREDYDLLFLTATLADALAREGRWMDIDQLYERATKTWPLGSDANALNVAANRARFLLYEGKAAEALILIDAVIADARRRGGEVNSDALSGMQQARACMLHELGRGEGAVLSEAFMSAARPRELAMTLLCLDRLDAARDVLLASVTNETVREDLFGFMQEHEPVPMQSDYGRRMHERLAKLRADPGLRAAIAPHARILPYSLQAGAPLEAAPTSTE
jgi:hypothetical protein